MKRRAGQSERCEVVGMRDLFMTEEGVLDVFTDRVREYCTYLFHNDFKDIKWEIEQFQWFAWLQHSRIIDNRCREGSRGRGYG